LYNKASRGGQLQSKTLHLIINKIKTPSPTKKPINITSKSKISSQKLQINSKINSKTMDTQTQARSTKSKPQIEKSNGQNKCPNPRR